MFQAAPLRPGAAGAPHDPELHPCVSFLAGAAAAALHPGPAAAQDQSHAPVLASEDEIIVTASPFGHELDDTPAITSSVDSDDILKSGGSSIAAALSKVPGVAGTGFASGASRPIIRGMDSNRVRLLENGTSVSDVSDVGPDHGVPIDPLSARRIEVVRGAATLRYGSQAIGGVVNAINDRVPMSLPASPFSGEVTGSYGTVDDAWQGSALADAALGNLALHADAFVRDTGDYSTPLGTEANTFFKRPRGVAWAVRISSAGATAMSARRSSSTMPSTAFRPRPATST